MSTPSQTSALDSSQDVERPESVEDLTPPNRRVSPNLVRGLSILVALGGWEIFGRQVNPLFMSYPSAIMAAAITVAATGELETAFLDSAKALVLGFALAAVVGILLGLLMGRYRLVEYALDPYVNALYATPLVAIIPLVMLWFGLGFNAKLFIVFIMTLFPILINTAAGVSNIGQSLVDVALAFAASERQVFTKIIMPAALPYIMTGLRLGIGRAIIGMVVAEFFTAITGLGAMIVKYGNFFKTDVMLVPVLLLMVLGIVLTELLKRAEAAIAPWKETERAQ
jgi:NitT/TauT family transport system permease protein